jgi:hypothetical protein
MNCCAGYPSLGIRVAKEPKNTCEANIFCTSSQSPGDPAERRIGKMRLYESAVFGGEKFYFERHVFSPWPAPLFARSNAEAHGL